MGRSITGTDSGGGIILSSAYKDWGTTGWKVNGTWNYVMNSSRWVTLKVMKDDPYFDIDWNLNIDHADTWDSEAMRLVFSYSTNNKSSWSTVRDTKNYSITHCYTNGTNVCGQSKGGVVLYNPSGLNLVAGNYVAFGLQAIHDSSSNNPYFNQTSENQNGNNAQNNWRGGGAFMRVREVDSSKITIWGSAATGTGNV
tara:strand:+ start:728 stop:1318 length:591 start_codon:yes stop_codon:yes gene_type:complete